MKEQEREELKKERVHERMIKRAEKSMKKTRPSVSHSRNDDDVFSDHGSEILGKEKHILLKKVSQYKSLFTEELKTFKVKRNASEAELKSYLEEMQTLVEINTLDEPSQITPRELSERIYSTTTTTTTNTKIKYKDNI